MPDVADRYYVDELENAGRGQTEFCAGFAVSDGLAKNNVGLDTQIIAKVHFLKTSSRFPMFLGGSSGDLNRLFLLIKYQRPGAGEVSKHCLRWNKTVTFAAAQRRRRASSASGQPWQTLKCQ